MQDEVIETTQAAIFDGHNAVRSAFFKPFNNSLDFAAVSRHKV